MKSGARSGAVDNTGSSGGGAIATAKGMLILVLLIIASGAGGYFFGTYQKFAPVENVAPSSMSLNDQSTSPGQGTTLSLNAPGSLKKKYWLHSSGDEHVGYAISVFVNGQMVDRIFTPNRDIDISKYVKPGENQVTFQAKVLPDGMREHKGNASYFLNISVKSGDAIGQSGAGELLNYRRNANEFEDYNDTLDFVTLE